MDPVTSTIEYLCTTAGIFFLILDNDQIKCYMEFSSTEADYLLPLLFLNTN